MYQVCLLLRLLTKLKHRQELVFWEEINKWELNNGHSTPGSSCLQIKINWNLWCWFCEGRKTQPTCDAKSVN